MLTEQGDEFALKSVRSALKAMHRPQMIGKHPLASLRFVRARHNKSGRPADLPSLGITMREILRDAIEALRPVGFRPIDEDIHVRDKDDLQFIILTERYLNGRRRDYLESILGLPQRTYYNHEQGALLGLGEKLREWEYMIADPEPVTSASASTSLTWELLQQAAKSESEHQMGRIREGKYNQRLYLNRNVLLRTFRDFLNSDMTSFVLTGKSGVGKTSFLLSLLDHYAFDADINVLLYDASHLVIRDSLLQRVSTDLSHHLGLTGELSDNLLVEAGRQIDMTGRTLVVAFDAINEHPNAREHIVAIDQMVGEARWPWLKIVISTRPHAWQILTGGLSLADERYYSQPFEQSRLIRPRESSIHLDRFSYEELEDVYGKYRKEYDIKTAYEDISFDIRREICDPLILRLLIEIASENNPKEIPPDLQVDAIYEQYMQALISTKRLQPQDSRFLEQDLMPLMFSEDIQQERISVQQIRIAETGDGLSLWDRIFEDKKVGLLRRKNDSFRRLVDAGILMQHVNNDIGFKYERFYDSYGGHRLLEVISSKSEEEKADFYHTLAEDILPLDKAFLWGSVQFALFNELDRDNANLFVDLANRNSQPVKEVVVAALCEYGQKRSSNRDFVTSILERLMHSGTSRDRKRRTVANGQGDNGLTRAMQKTLFARRTAIEVASALEVVEILEEASRDPMPQVRTVAAQYTYYLWRRNPDAAYDVLRLLSQRMQIWGIVPDQTAIETCISLSLVIIFYDQSASVRNALQDIWRDNLDRLLFVPHYDTNIRGWFLAHFREFLITAVTNLTLDYINELDKDMDVNRVVFTVDEILHFFDLPLEKKTRFQRLIKFVDANETNIQDAKEDLLSASKDRDLLTMYLNVMVTAAHILRERESTLEILEAMTDESLKAVPPTPSMVTAPIVLASAIEFDDADSDMRFLDLLRYVNEKNLTLARCRCQAVQEIFFWPGEASYLNLVSSRKGIVDFETANRYFRTVIGKNRHEFDIELLNVFQHFFVRSSTQCGNVAGAVQILLQLVDGDSLPSDKYVREEVQRITLRYLATLWTYDPKEVERALVEADSSDDLRDMIHKTTPHEGFSALISNQFSDFVLESLVRGENQLVIGNIQESLRDVAQRSKPDRKIIRDVMVKAINIVYGEQLLKS